jgi:hypothetical protein
LTFSRVAPTNTGDIAYVPTLWVPELLGADLMDVLDGNFDRVIEFARDEPVLVIVGVVESAKNPRPTMILQS